MCKGLLAFRSALIQQGMLVFRRRFATRLLTADANVAHIPVQRSRSDLLAIWSEAGRSRVELATSCLISDRFQIGSIQIENN